MAIRLEKSGELMMIYGKKDDEPDVQAEWNTRRRKLGVLVAAVAIVTAVLFLGPRMPEWEMLSHALKAVVAAVW